MPSTPKRRGNKKAPKDLPGVIKEAREIIKAAQGIHETVVLTHPNARAGSRPARRRAGLPILRAMEPRIISILLKAGSSCRRVATGLAQTPEQDLLTVRCSVGLRLKGAQIAYLSACSTAENKAAWLSDEVIHLVSGFQVAGFPHVIGCLWPAGDSGVWRWRGGSTLGYCSGRC